MAHAQVMDLRVPGTPSFRQAYADAAGNATMGGDLAAITASLAASIEALLGNTQVLCRV